MRRIAALVALSVIATTLSVAEAVPAFAVGEPDPPTAVTATAGDTQASVSWTAGADNGNAITNYTVTSSPDGKTCTNPSTSCTVSSLTNGTAYTFTVIATNIVGDSVPSAASNSVTPLAPPPPDTVPDAPTIGTATPGSQAATVTWTAPVNDGGQPITKYVVSSSPGNKHCNGGGVATQCTVIGLAKGGTYTFTVIAHNIVGDSLSSGATAPITLANAPDAPSGVVADSGYNQTVPVTWVAPLDNGSPITGYTASASPGGAHCSVVPPALTCNVLGLVNGTAYTFTVVATNVEGDSSPSAASAPATPAYSPGVVRSIRMAAGRGTIHLSWLPPLDNGGSPIFDYLISVGGGAPIHTVGPSTSIVISRLAAGRSIPFTIQAHNGAVNGSQGIPTTVVALGSTATMKAYPAGVIYGRWSRLAGLLRSTTAARLGRQIVRVQLRTVGNGRWQSLASFRADSLGVYRIRVRPSENTEYRVVYYGAGRVLGSASRAIRVGVAWRIRLQARPRTVQVGQVVNFTGRVKPLKRHKTVLLQKLEGRKWVTKQSARTSVRGVFRLRNRPKKAGTFLYRIYLGRSAGHLAAASGRVRVNVAVKPKPKPKPKPGTSGAFSVTASASASRVVSGSTVYFGGRVSPSSQPKSVLLQKLENGAWVTKQSAKSLANGSFRISYTPSKRGTFSYRVYVSATKAHRAGVSRRITLSIL